LIAPEKHVQSPPPPREGFLYIRPLSAHQACLHTNSLFYFTHLWYTTSRGSRGAKRESSLLKCGSVVAGPASPAETSTGKNQIQAAGAKKNSTIRSTGRSGYTARKPHSAGLRIFRRQATYTDGGWMQAATNRAHCRLLARGERGALSCTRPTFCQLHREHDRSHLKPERMYLSVVAGREDTEHARGNDGGCFFRRGFVTLFSLILPSDI
jgi:hypothetical protein